MHDLKWRGAMAAAAALLVFGCHHGLFTSNDSTPAVDYAAVAAAAVNDPARPEADRERDGLRKPETTLQFFKIGPGQTLFEMEAGNGWYTEILSRAVGPNGEVIMQNPEGFMNFLGEALAKRLADDRLPNVRQSLSPFDKLGADDASVDVVTWFWGPHELYFHPKSGEHLGDPTPAFAEMYRILKPGGELAIIDHSAQDGAPETTGGDLHRIDKAIVIRLAEAAGFTLEDEADFLANPEDDRTLSVFDPAIRGKTDRFVLKFRKPK